MTRGSTEVGSILVRLSTGNRSVSPYDRIVIEMLGQPQQVQ